MNRLMTCAVSVVAIGLSAPACAADHGVVAAAEHDVLSSIAATFGASASTMNSGGNHDSAADSAVPMPSRDPASADSISTRKAVSPVPGQLDKATASPDRSQTGTRPRRGERSTLSWQSLIPGSIQS